MQTPIIQDRTEFVYHALPEITHERLFNPSEKSLFAALFTNLLEICLRFESCTTLPIYQTMVTSFNSQRNQVTSSKPKCKDLFDYSFKAIDIILMRNVDIRTRYGYIVKYMKQAEAVPSMLLTLQYIIKERLNPSTSEKMENNSYEISHIIEIVEATAIIFDVNIIILLENAEIIKINEESNKAQMFLYVRNSGITSILYSRQMIELEAHPEKINMYSHQLVSHKVLSYPDFSQKVPGSYYTTSPLQPSSHLPPVVNTSNNSPHPPQSLNFNTVDNSVLKNTVYNSPQVNFDTLNNKPSLQIRSDTPTNYQNDKTSTNFHPSNQFQPDYNAPPGTNLPIVGQFSDFTQMNPKPFIPPLNQDDSKYINKSGYTTNNIVNPTGHSGPSPSVQSYVPGSNQSFLPTTQPFNSPPSGPSYLSNPSVSPGSNAFPSPSPAHYQGSPADYPKIDPVQSHNNSSAPSYGNSNQKVFIPNIGPPVKPLGYVTTVNSEFNTNVLPPPPSQEERIKAMQPPPGPYGNQTIPLMTNSPISTGVSINPANQINPSNPINPPMHPVQAMPDPNRMIPGDLINYLKEIGAVLKNYGAYDENLRRFTYEICQKYPEIDNEFLDIVMSIPSIQRPLPTMPIIPASRPETVRRPPPNMLPPGQLPPVQMNPGNSPNHGRPDSNKGNFINPSNNNRKKLCKCHQENENEDSFSDISCLDCKSEVCTRCRIQDLQSCVFCGRDYSKSETEILEILKMTITDYSPPHGFRKSIKIGSGSDAQPQLRPPPYQEFAPPQVNPVRMTNFQVDPVNNHFGADFRHFQQNKLCEVHGGGANQDYFTTDVNCPDGCQVCNQCRFQNMESCSKCDRVYSNSEKEMLQVLKMTST